MDALLCCSLLLSRVQLFVTPWTAACQASLFYLPELAQTHVHWVSDAIQLSHPLLSPSPPAFSISQHQGLFQWSACICVYSTFTWNSFFSTCLISPSIPNHYSPQDAALSPIIIKKKNFSRSFPPLSFSFWFLLLRNHKVHKHLILLLSHTLDWPVENVFKDSVSYEKINVIRSRKK